MDRGTNGGGAGVSFEDQRALQLAFELSMLGIPEGSFFFFKQKTAYEIGWCDWSSDVCSSDLG